MHNKIPKIIVISGPTASGKSFLAEELAFKYPSVIINADSMQVYKELPLLSAQPNINQSPNKYNMYSTFNFYEKCSVGVWLEQTHKCIKEARRSNKLPIIIGGTGLYIKALLEGIAQIPDIKPSVKQEVHELFSTLGKTKFHEQLILLDPSVKNKIHENDSYRMQRAMEVMKQTGQSITSFKTKASGYNALHLFINPDRDALYKNCNARFEEMIKQRAINEVEVLFKEIQQQPSLPRQARDDVNSTLHHKYNIENTLGYRSLVKYISGKCTLEETIFEAQQLTRNYAKRQYTWFRNQFANKVSFTYESSISEIIKKALGTITKSNFTQ